MSQINYLFEKNHKSAKSRPVIKCQYIPWQPWSSKLAKNCLIEYTLAKKMLARVYCSYMYTLLPHIHTPTSVGNRGKLHPLKIDQL